MKGRSQPVGVAMTPLSSVDRILRGTGSIKGLEGQMETSIMLAMSAALESAK
jgi:hypothetical protein